MLDNLRRLNHVLPLIVLFSGLSLTWISSGINIALSTVFLITTLFLLYLEVVTQLSFRAPMKRKPPLNDSNWTKVKHHVDGKIMVSHYFIKNTSAPTVFICHGWTSGSQRMLGRAELFIQQGYNVIMIDLPGHGESQSITKWTAEQSSTMVIDTLNQLYDMQPNLFNSRMLIFGHSMGGFISLRLSKRRKELKMHSILSGWITESPMTGYTEIFEETCNLLRIPSMLRPIVLKKSIRQFNALNSATPDLMSLADVDCPEWGAFEEPTLLIQADPDERLGTSHYLRLQEVMQADSPSLLTSVLLDDLAHSGAAVHKRRDEVIRQWIQNEF